VQKNSVFAGIILKNISCAFKELRDVKDLFDVTLFCGDEEIQAHKVILSSCSPFEILRGVLSHKKIRC
jgi:hypothetical protein